MLAKWPQGRRIALSAAFSLCVAILVITAFRGMSEMFVVRILQTLAIAVAAVGLIGLVMASVTGRLADYREPADEEEFEQLVRRSERLARENLAAEPDEDEFLQLDPRNPADFEELVREALLRDFGDDPDELRAQVTRTVRHELAHHLGADELGVRELGL